MHAEDFLHDDNRREVRTLGRARVIGGHAPPVAGRHFDHAAAVTNFVIQPLTLLSGTFYAIDRVNPTMKAISHSNPFFYIIDGFRSGFIGVSDGLLVQGAVILALVNVALWTVCYRVIRSGWRLKA
jgi:ABC-2 type transport system permease protein